MATPIQPTASVATFTAPATYVVAAMAIAAVVTSITGTAVAPWALLVATVVAGVVTLVGVMRGSGPLSERLAIAGRDLVAVLLAIVQVVPHPVATAKRVTRALTRR